jgi:hypothetical protein
MYDRLSVQTEVDYKRERLSRSASTKKNRAERTRIPFLGDQVNRRVR